MELFIGIVLGSLIGAAIIFVVLKSKTAGTLWIDKSNPNNLDPFLALAESDVEIIRHSKFVTLEVKSKDRTSQK